MALRHYANAPATSLTLAASSSATLIEVASVTGLPIQYPYTIIVDRGLAAEEVMSVTAGSGNSLTVVRGYDSTAAFAHSVGAEVVHGISAIDPREANEHVNSTSDVHGIAGSVVGTTDTQTVTNKDLTSETNTMPASLAREAFIAPIGAVVEWLTDTPPTNWLILNGQAVSRTTYSDLFALWGTTFGTGDGSTTFNLPDRRDRAAVGASGTKAVGATGGADTVTLATANLPAHSHSMAHTHAIDHDHASFSTGSGGTHNHTFNFQWNSNDTLGGAAERVTDIDNQTTGTGTAANASTTSDGSHTHTVDVPAFTGTSGASSAANTGSTGSGTAVNIQNKYLATHFIVRAL